MLMAHGRTMTGLGRDPERARRQLQNRNWIKADLKDLGQADDWTLLLDGQDAVVNCAGALQDGLHDDLAASQDRAMRALYAAAAVHGLKCLVQVSANTEASGAETAFLATKRAADKALVASGLAYVIVRPALVLGRNAFGGTALIRALAAMPYALALVHADSRVATVSVDDGAQAVLMAITGEIAPGADLHLAAPESTTLADLVQLHRQWLGLRRAPIIALPAWIARPVGWIADGLGRLGWRSPLRSTALAVMTGGVKSSAATSAAALMPISAKETLARHQAGIQDLWFARLYRKREFLRTF
jgi:uncharacterized protein YbjT (DUF2867 family)